MPDSNASPILAVGETGNHHKHHHGPGAGRQRLGDHAVVSKRQKWGW